jgi:hypothetical protein
MNINAVNTNGYENNRLSRRSENKPNSNPIQTQSKPIQRQLKPIKCQNKPNTNPNKPNFKGKKMLPHLTFNGRRKSFGGQQVMNLTAHSQGIKTYLNCRSFASRGIMQTDRPCLIMLLPESRSFIQEVLTRKEDS